MATRVAEELGSEVGDLVGFKVRFSDHARPESYIKFMTDGILLAEELATLVDPSLRGFVTRDEPQAEATSSDDAEGDAG